MLKCDLGKVARAKTILSATKGSECKLQSPGIIAWVWLYADTGRTIIIATKRVRVEMIQVGDEGLMIFRYAELVGWIICWEEGVEKTMEFSSAYEADIANLHGHTRVPWTWPPQGMSIRGIFESELFAEDIVVGHRDRKSGNSKLERNFSTLAVVR